MSNENVEKPWQKQPSESTLWHERFRLWLNQEQPRSLLKVCNQEREKRGHKRTNNIPASWRDKPIKYHWRARADAYDAAECERKDRELKKQREQQRQRELRAAERLYEKADDLMDLSHLREVEKDEEGTRILVPDYRAFKTASDLYAEARANARAALEMIDKRVVDPSKLSTDALLKLLATLDDTTSDDTAPFETEENNSPSVSSNRQSVH